MDLEEVKVCLRGLLSSTAVSCNLNRLLYDFRNMTGFDLPLFGYIHPIEFLRTLNDTVQVAMQLPYFSMSSSTRYKETNGVLQLFGNPYNPEVALVQSVKSAHITSLVDRQKTNTTRSRHLEVMARPKRLIIPDRNLMKNYLFYSGGRPQFKNDSDTKPSHMLPEPKTSNEHTQKTVSSIPVEYLTCETVKDKTRPASPVQENSKIQGEPNNTKISHFEDISDSESCLSIEDGRSSCAASSSCFVNEGIKNKLKRLIKYYPKGLWCCELPESFQKEYNFALDYREYGYTSLIQMLSELPDVFRCIRPGNEDWLLFDASVAPSPEEKKMMDLQATADINCEVTANVRKLLFNYFENASNTRIDFDGLLDSYKKMFGCCLDFQSLGFKDLKSFLKMWDGSLFSFLDFDGKTYLVPVLKVTVQSTIHWQEALPPITAENDIFVEIFPKDVVGPEESLLELDLARHVAVSSVVKVSVAEVWSPSLFYLQLNKFKERLDVFMDDLQRFYNVHLTKYKMPDSTVRPKQICVGLYTSDPDIPDEWHRAQIVKVINEKMVLVNFVDFGTEARVKKTHLRFLHRSFQSFPVQGLLAQLSGVAPADGGNKWPITTSKRFLEFVRVPFLDAEIVDIDFKKPRLSVILSDPSQKSKTSINRKLIQMKLAVWREPDFCFLVNKPVTNRREAETKSEEAKSSEKKAHKATGARVEDSFSKSLPEITDEFSDIADLGQATPFKMRSLKHEDSSSVAVKSEKSSIEHLKFEFDDVPDLYVKVEEEKTTTSGDISAETRRTEPASVPSEELGSCIPPVAAPPTIEKPRSPSPRRSVGAPLPEASPSVQPQPATAVPSLESLRISSPEPRELKSPPLEGLHTVGSQSVHESPAAAAVVPPEKSRPLSPDTTAVFSHPGPFPRKPKRLPPGLEHPNPMPSFEQIDFLPPPDDLKKKINILAMEFLTTNSSIKQVGLNDPVLAVKIATDMAEACITSRYCKEVPCGLIPPAMSAALLQPDGGGDLPSEQVPRAAATIPSNKAEDLISPKGQSRSPPGKREKENEFVQKREVGGKTLHLVTIDQQAYFCAEEIIRNFSAISGREVADRILQIKKIHIDYRIITKGTDERVLNAIKSSQLQTVKKKSKKLKVFLIPLAMVLPFLQGLGCNTKAYENDILKLQ